MNLVILADIWHSVPFIALILQAALATLPYELEEAAAVDGANAFQRFWSNRLPLLRPAILVALVIRSVEAFRVFDIIYDFTNWWSGIWHSYCFVFDLPWRLSVMEISGGRGCLISNFYI